MINGWLAKALSSPMSAKPSFLNSRMNICAALLALRSGKGRRRSLQMRWNVPHAVGAIDGKHIAMKKPKKTGSDYYNYKGFFFVVLLALVDAEHRFLWIDCGSVCSCAEAQLFNRSELREMVEDGTLRLLAP